MLVTAHLFMGAVIGKYFDNLWLVIVLALLSHYVLDAVPHYNPHALSSKRFSVKLIAEAVAKSLEPLIGTLLILLIASHDPKATLIVIGAFFAFLPDFVDGILWALGGRFRALKYFMNKYHHHSRNFRGIVPQVALVLIALLLL